MTNTTDTTKTPFERGLQHGYADESMDWNEETGQHNPYKPGTNAFREYEEGFDAACGHLADAMPWA